MQSSEGRNILNTSFAFKKTQQPKLLNIQAVAHLEYSEITSGRDGSKWQ